MLEDETKFKKPIVQKPRLVTSEDIRQNIRRAFQSKETKDTFLTKDNIQIEGKQIPKFGKPIQMQESKPVFKAKKTFEEELLDLFTSKGIKVEDVDFIPAEDNKRGMWVITGTFRI